MLEISSLMMVCVLEEISLVTSVLEEISSLMVICVWDGTSLATYVLEEISLLVIYISVVEEEEEVSLEEDSFDWDLASAASLSTVFVMVVVLLTW